jgi:iron(III) transport system ATP-binding protein
MEGLHKHFAGKPPTTPMDGIDLDIANGEFLVLLGPSGCGKTTTLRCVAGLETPDSGRIAFGDHVVFDSSRRINLTPDKRNIGMVFQSYALWPHMTVRKNIGYPLRARRIKTTESKDWVSETATLVDCQNLLDRYPAQLSGGQQQRVALARGLVARPEVVLFDEPLSNLDARLRDLVRAQLHELHARLGFTAIFVTHDQSEALALADRMAIMRSGRFEQIGTPLEVFQHPATEYVAEFIGMANRIELTRSTDGWTVAGQAVAGRPPITAGVDVVVARMRPDDVALGPDAASLPTAALTFDATFVDAQFGGRHLDITTELEPGNRVNARVPVDAHGGWANHLELGAPVTVGIGRHGVAYFQPGGARIDADPAVPAALTAAGVT